MNRITALLIYSALAIAGLVGISLSVPLQSPTVILLGLSGLFVVIKLIVSKERSKLLNPWLILMSMAATGYFAMRACVSPVWDLGMEDLMLILPSALLYLVAAYGLTGVNGVSVRQGMARVVIALMLLNLGAALMQIGGYEGYSLSRIFAPASVTKESGVTGMYTYYGSFANFAVVAGLLCLSLGTWGRFVLAVRGGFLLLGALSIGLAVWSQSRSSAVSLLMALAVFTALVLMSLSKQREQVKRRARIVIMTCALLGLVAGVAGGVWVFKERANNESVVGVEMMFDSGVRMPFWSMAAEQWADHPIVGAGSRSYSYESFRYWSPNLPTGEANPEFAHNEYLQLLADYGLIGLMLVLTLFAGHFAVGFKRIQTLSVQVGEDGLVTGSNAMALAIAGVCGMVAIAVHIAFDFRTHLLANLLLLVCCAVWILPVAKSTVWKSGSRGVWKSRMGSWVLGLIMMVLGLGAIGLGGQQLWGGLPLIENKMAKEDGAWIPQEVNRDVWIPMLEESVSRSPNWRRSQRLGTLYRIEADSLEGNEQEDAMGKAKAAYSASIERHAHNPIPWINLASIYSEKGQYEKADEAYARASEMAKARERWFRMHSYWARMHQDWAVDYWKIEKVEQAEEHFLRAKDLYKLSYDYAYFYQNKQWVVEYTQLLITYAGFLDDLKKYSEAEQLFDESMQQVNWHNWQTDTKLNFYYAKHLYKRGKYIWFQRKPEQAFEMMKRAKAQLLQHKAMMKSDVEAGYDKQFLEIQKVISFLDETGVGK